MMSRLLVALALALVATASARPSTSDAPALKSLKKRAKKESLARRRLSDDIGNDVFYECMMLTDIEADHCAWETFDDGFTGDTTACEAECAARDSCWAIQYDEVGGWCDGCHYEQSCLSVDDIAQTSGSASFMTRGCFDATSRPSTDDDWYDLADDYNCGDDWYYDDYGYYDDYYFHDDYYYYEDSDPYCSQMWCTSDGGDYEHHDCWAGSPGEPCTCSQGEARETGATHHDGQHNYYEYTCCTVGSGRSGRGEECGDCACRAGVHARACARARAHLPSL